MEELNKEPPLVLVITWLDLLKNAEEKMARDRANKMLLGAFDNDKITRQNIEQLESIIKIIWENGLTIITAHDQQE